MHAKLLSSEAFFSPKCSIIQRLGSAQPKPIAGLKSPTSEWRGRGEEGEKGRPLYEILNTPLDVSHRFSSLYVEMAYPSPSK